jgi:hypothetical protein
MGNMLDDTPVYPNETAEPEPQASAEPLEGGEEESEQTAGFDYEDPQFLEAVERAADQRLTSLLEQAAQYEQPAEGQEQDAELDPYGDPTGFRSYMEQIVSNALENRFSQIEPTVRQFEDAQNAELIGEWTEKIPAVKEVQELVPEDQVDQFNASELVQFMASGYLPDLEQRYGPGERAVQGALRMAADQLKGFALAIHKSGYQGRNAELGRLAGARAPMPAAVESSELREMPADEMAAASLWASRNGLE